MAKLLVLVLGLAAIAFAVKFALAPTARQEALAEPARQLDNVRSRAKEFERDLQRRAEPPDVEGDRGERR